MKYFIKCWKHFADFKGRARRKEYWMFLLFNYIISFALGMVYYVGLILQLTNSADAEYYSGGSSSMLWTGGGLVFVFFCIMVIYCWMSLIPTLAVIVRRLHDIGRKGTWLWLLVFLILFYGILLSNVFSVTVVVVVGILITILSMGISVLMIVLGCIDGHKGENQYGPNPKELEEAENK
ncbi:MAG: DUF805 domain-containing protein [Bacteroidales bacterium]|nr:DUF805 domain-containing protein [Bacteroidales bacterium]